MFCMYRFSLWLYVKVCACHALIKATYLLTYLLTTTCNYYYNWSYIRHWGEEQHAAVLVVKVSHQQWTSPTLKEFNGYGQLVGITDQLATWQTFTNSVTALRRLATKQRVRPVEKNLPVAIHANYDCSSQILGHFPISLHPHVIGRLIFFKSCS